MTTFAFTLILCRSTLDLDEADRLYGRCRDATLVTSLGLTRVEFNRRALTLGEAMRSAAADVEAVGLNVDRVELERDALAVA